MVSTLDDYLAFGQMMLDGGILDGTRILSRPSVEVMTSDQFTPAQMAVSPFFPGFWETSGWGFGISVTTQREGIGPTPGSFGWDGGVGTSWRSDPREEMVTILLTQVFPITPELWNDFWTATYAAIDD